MNIRLCLGFAVLFICARFIDAQISCQITQLGNCIYDEGDKRVLPFQASTDGLMTWQICAAACYRYNYSISGVEFGTQCFCGNKYLYTPSIAPANDCRGMPCPGNSSEYCGNSNRMQLITGQCTGRALPTGHACADSTSKALPFCDTKLTINQRLNDLVGRLTTDEKLGLLGADQRTGVDPCSCMSAGVPRLGISGILQLVETNSGVSSGCLAENVCGSVFPGPTCLAASFNRSLWHAKGTALSDEMRAFNNYGWHRGQASALINLIGYGPNINIVRDPRFGRNSELPSEDPFLSGSYAVNYVQGCQIGEDPRFFKMVSGLKHYALYSVEANRGSFIPNVNNFDLHDTYLKQYKMGFDAKQGNAQATMCSYAGLNGVPSCANDFLLNKVVRQGWDRPDVLVVSDCGAIGNMVNANKYAKNNADAAAKSLNAGTDIDLGDFYYPPVANGGNGALPTALSQGLTNTSHLNTAVSRILEKRFMTGQFDPIEDQPYTLIPISVVNSSAHWDLMLDGVLQGLVLLKNDKNTLPFAAGKKLAVVGPHILSTRDLMEDYKGDEECFGGGDSCLRTIAEVFTTMHGAQNTKTAIGVTLAGDDTSGIKPAMDIVDEADQVVLCIGIGNTQEHEGIDRSSIVLPGLQEKFASMVLAAGKPTVIVIISGGIVSIDNLVSPAPAIVQAFYPSFRTGEALYKSIFGLENRWGKLPVTIYSSSFTNDFQMTDFDMTKAPGRTYRYYTKQPLFSFGHGLSYTQFNISCSSKNNKNISSIACLVKNTGSVAGEEVIQVYHSVGSDIKSKVNHPVPIKSLVAFDRFHVPLKGQANAEFTLNWNENLVLTNGNGDMVLYAGTHYLEVTNGVSASEKFTITVATTQTVQVNPKP